jgi:hypothetical protein
MLEIRILTVIAIATSRRIDQSNFRRFCRSLFAAGSDDYAILPRGNVHTRLRWRHEKQQAEALDMRSEAGAWEREIHKAKRISISTAIGRTINQELVDMILQT